MDASAAFAAWSLHDRGTPKAAALAEQAAVEAIRQNLDDGTTSVGTHIAVDHVAPTPVGGTVVATAVVAAVEGRTVRFSISVTQGDREVAKGSHTRAIVERSRFEEAAART